MRKKIFFLILLLFIATTFLVVFGESGFSMDSTLVWQLRLPKIISCIVAGAILASSGLLMQLFFQNPLAGPDILGVSSGASLFVALWIMAAHKLPLMLQSWGMNIMSFLGSLMVFLLLIFFIKKQISKMSLIIIGVLLSSFTSSCISILFNLSNELQVKNFLMWGNGSFRNLSSEQVPILITCALISLIPIVLFHKSLNQFLLSENYARSVGVDIRKMKMVFISIAAFQVSLVTLYCGPIGFIGIIAPHIARFLMKQSQLKNLFPATILMGALFGLLTEVILVLAPNANLSVNSILGFIGAPIIFLFLINKREWAL